MNWSQVDEVEVSEPEQTLHAVTADITTFSRTGLFI